MCLAGALWVYMRLWRDPAAREPAYYASDPAQHKWFLAHGLRVVTGAVDPFFTEMLNAPHGVNLMANTTMLGLGVPLAPVTWLFGVDVSLAVALTVGLAGTAFAWYWLLSRHVVTSPLAAAVGGLFCGFAPSMVSHAGWHTNFVAQFLVPFIVWRVLKLAEEGRVVRNGVILGLLVAYQAFVNEEILLFTALASGVFLGIWALQRRRFSWTFVKALGVTGLVAFALLAYPLWVQFFGPMHYSGLSSHGFNVRADAISYFAFGTETVSGIARANEGIAPNFAEENTFLGLPLLVLVAVIVWWRRRDVVIRALALTAGVFALFSLGTRIRINGHSTGIPGPWAVLDRVPILDAVMPSRFGLVVTACVGVLLALGTDEYLRVVREAGHEETAPEWTRRQTGRLGLAPARLLGLGALAVALLPVAPTPLRMIDHEPMPRFITDGGWRAYVTPGQTLVPIPIPEPGEGTGMHWAALNRLEFAIPRGYFMGPEEGVAGNPGTFGAPKDPAVELINRIRIDEDEPLVAPTPVWREEVVKVLREWNAAVIVLNNHYSYADEHLENLTILFGQGQLIGDAWVWDVRGIVRGSDR
ncbi:MAG TPA: hypothetical protein VF062_29780 [Candidatus Limnocylindrales bacterium]